MNAPMNNERPKPLTRKDIGFRIKDEHRAFFVKGFARFMKPGEIFAEFASKHRDLIEADVQRHGPDLVREYVCERIYRLNPNAKNTDYLDSHLMEIFESEREAHLKDLDSVYLAHPKNRLQELNALYDIAMGRVMGDDGDKRDIQDALAILREARSEMASKSISVTASVEDGNAMLAIHSNVQNLSNDKIKALMERHERGEPISIPDPSGNGSRPVLPNPATGDEGASVGGESGAPEETGKAPQA